MALPAHFLGRTSIRAQYGELSDLTGSSHPEQATVPFFTSSYWARHCLFRYISSDAAIPNPSGATSTFPYFWVV